jgi:CRISPR-associated protein Cas2
MRATYIVSYDICDPDRLRKVFKICKNYGNHLQYSVFECDLAEAERLRLERELGQVMNLAEDQVLFIHLGPAEGRGDRVITALGTPYSRIDSACFVV